MPDKAHSNVAIEFVWLDVACIDQTPNHPQMAFEIGRQARIFRKAKRVFVWVTQSTHEKLEKNIRRLRVAQEAVGRIHLGKAEDLPILHNWTSIPENQGWLSLQIIGSGYLKWGRALDRKSKTDG